MFSPNSIFTNPMRISLVAASLAIMFAPDVPVAAAASATNSPIVRIALQKVLARAAKVDIAAPSPIRISVFGGSEFIYRGAGPVTAVASKSDEITLQALGMKDIVAGASQIKITPLEDVPVSVGIADTHRARHYRGSIEVIARNHAVAVTDCVKLEDYLCSVVPAEIGTNAPLEAMKAQAVAARTYTLANLHKFASLNCDLDDTTRSQNYAGVDGESALSSAAVRDTAGDILTYNGTLVEALYSTDSGGVTACDQSGTRPYFQSVRDGIGDVEFGAGQSNHSWSLVLSKDAMAASLALDTRTKVIDFDSLAVDGYDSSGRITSVTVRGTDGTAETVSGSVFRGILGPDKLKSTRASLRIMPDNSYKFDGTGWGHGYGMSQRGAIALASPPYSYSYSEILAKYYVGAVVTPISSVQGAIRSASRLRP